MRGQFRNVGYAVGVVVIVIGLLALLQAYRLQARVDREYVLQQAQTALLERMASGQGVAGIESALRILVFTPRYGFRQLEWLGVRSQRRIRVSRLDESSWSLLSESWSDALAQLSAATGAARGVRMVQGPDQQTGTLSWVHRDPVAVAVHDKALSNLRLLGGFVVLLGVLMVAAWVVVLRKLHGGGTLAQRLTATPVARPPPGSEERRRPGRAAMGEAMDELGEAVMIVDAGKRVRYMNHAAERLCGWSAAEASGRLVYSVFHPLDLNDQPLCTPAETALSYAAPQHGVELRLRARDGRVHLIEVDAASSGVAEARYAVMLFRDISQRRRKSDEMHAELDRQRLLLDHLADGILLTSADGRIRCMNARAERMFGYQERDLIGTNISRLMPVPFMNSPNIRLQDYAGTDARGAQARVVGWRQDATTFPVDLLVELVPDPPLEGLVVTIRDATERRRGEAVVNRIGRILDASSTEVYVLDPQTLDVLEMNASAIANLGYSSGKFRGMRYPQITHGMSAADLAAVIDEQRKREGANESMQVTHQRADGSHYRLRMTMHYARNEEPPVILATGEPVSDDPA